MKSKPLDLTQFDGPQTVGRSLAADRETLLAECRRQGADIERLREIVRQYIEIDERKAAAIAKRPYGIGARAVAERLTTARAALAGKGRS